MLTPEEVEHDPQIVHRGVLKRDGEKLFVAMPSRFGRYAGASRFARAEERGTHRRNFERVESSTLIGVKRVVEGVYASYHANIQSSAINALLIVNHFQIGC